MFIQYMIIYILFILGISIVSEWLSCKIYIKNKSDNDIDMFLENVKMDLKKQYYFQMQEYMSRQPEHFSQYSYDPEQYNTKQYSTEEKDIMKKVNDKLIQGQLLGYHAAGRKSLGYTYNKVDDPHINEITQANLHTKYKTIPRQINWQEPAKLVIPRKDSYNIDYKYEFEPSQKSNTFNIPGSSGQAPDKYFFKNNPKLRHTFLDEKYDPKNYPVQAVDDYANSYSIFE